VALTAFLPPTLLSGLSDVSVSPGSAQNGYPLTWNNTLGKWVASPIPAPDYSVPLSFTSTTESTSSTTGGLVLAGGLGVGKRINAGGAISCGNPSATTAQLTVSGGAAGGPIIALARTIGAILTFDWSLSGNKLSFRNTTAGVVTCQTGFSQNLTAHADLTIGGDASGGVDIDGVSGILTASRSGGAGQNKVGGNLVIASGQGNGTGTPSSISLRTPTLAASGTTRQAWVERILIDNTAVTVSHRLIAAQSINFANLPTSSTGLSVGDLWRDGDQVRVKI